MEDPEETKEWYNQLEVEDAGEVCIALAVTLFPNLRTITITDGAEVPLKREIIKRIAKANMRSPPVVSVALSKLSEVVIAKRIRETFNEFANYSGLPSMRRLHGIETMEDNFTWNSDPPTSEISELTFEASAIDVSCIREFLRGIKIQALRKFKYEASGLAVSYFPWEPHKIVACLLEKAKDSLEELELTPSPSHELEVYDMIIHDMNYPGTVASTTFMGSLRAFKNLKHIRVYAGAFYNEVWDRQLGPELRLVDALPASVETLRLFGHLDKAEGTALFSGMPTLKKQRLPRLREVTFCKSIPLYKHMRSHCEGLGIRFEVVQGL